MYDTACSPPIKGNIHQCQSYEGTIMEKSSVPSSLDYKQFETLFQSEVMPLL